MSTRGEIHSLIDQLPDDRLEEAKSRLEPLRNGTDPVAEFFRDAPLDDEPYTDAERRLDDAAWQRHGRGESIPLSDLR